MRNVSCLAGLLGLLTASLLAPAAVGANPTGAAQRPHASTSADVVVHLPAVRGKRARPATTAAAMQVYAGNLLREVNRARATFGLRRLKADRRLSAAARRYSAELATTGTLSHTGRDGSGPADRVRAAGFPGGLVGETLAVGYGPAATVRAWLNSPGHRAILLDGRFGRIGLGAARGPFAGRASTYVAASFGS